MIAAAILSLGTNVASAATLTFQQGLNGYSGTVDTMIRSNVTAAGAGQSGNGDSTNSSFGNLDYISVDGDDGSPGNKPNHGLIRFDNLFGNAAGQIKTGDTILSATLTLTVHNPGSGMSVHDMLVNWSGSSTWNSLGNGIQTNGSEAAAAPIFSIGANNGSENVVNGTLTIDVTSSLLAMQNGATLYGWAFLPYASGTNGIDIYTSEVSVASLRPTLSIEVAPVPEPEQYAMLLAGLGVIGALVRRRKQV